MTYFEEESDSLIYYTSNSCYKILQMNYNKIVTQVFKNKFYFLPKCLSISSTLSIYESHKSKIFGSVSQSLIDISKGFILKFQEHTLWNLHLPL